MSARRYRLGRGAAWLLSLSGWIVMAGGLVTVMLGVFQVIVLDTRDLLILAPYLGGGLVILLNGLFMVAGAQLMLAVFDIAMSGRALELGKPVRSAGTDEAQPVTPPAPQRDPRGRSEPVLQRGLTRNAE